MGRYMEMPSVLSTWARFCSDREGPGGPGDGAPTAQPHSRLCRLTPHYTAAHFIFKDDWAAHQPKRVEASSALFYREWWSGRLSLLSLQLKAFAFFLLEVQ